MKHDQQAWSLVGWLNLMAVAILIVALNHKVIAWQWILAGTGFAFLVTFILVWSIVRK